MKKLAGLGIFVLFVLGTIIPGCGISQFAPLLLLIPTGNDDDDEPIPEVQSVSPSSGPQTGGTPVVISGQGFQDGCTVSFGGNSASPVTFVSDSQVACDSPAAASPGPVDVAVTNPGGLSHSLATGFIYDDNVPPANVSSFSASPGNLEIDLSWVNPSDTDFSGVLIRRSTTGTPTLPTDGALVYDGANLNYTDIGLTEGVTYYYRAFAHDGVPNHASGVDASAIIDVTPPNAIADLSLFPGTNDGEIDLTWTAPGDDGSTGTATSYVVKFSTSVMNDGNFSSASTYMQSWTPVTAGSAENRTMTGLIPGQTYYVAIKTQDEVLNISPISNLPSSAAQGVLDTTAPDAITDLSATTGSSSGQIDITFTAPGDDGAVGTATAYVVKYSLALIDAGNWASATTYTQSWTPLSGGSTESRTISGLSSGVTYYVAMVTEDEVPNPSGLSNVPSAMSGSSSDSTPPAAITDLAAATGTSAGQIDITFTAPGDDGTTGTATAYVVKYSLGPINAGNWASATTFTQSWTPLSGGSSESRTISGLTAGWTYNVAIITEDEVPNSSGISNVPSAVAASGGDTVAPAAVTDLSAISDTALGTVLLSWTATGDDGAVGTATSYEVRYSTAAITSGNYASATLYTQTWVPQTTGQTETFTISGLTLGTTYYFSVVVKDEVPNASGVSNSPSAAVMQTWSWVNQTPTNSLIRGIWGSSSTDVYAVTMPGSVLHYNGTTWSPMSCGTNAALFDIWGSSASDVFAVGINGIILHYDGTNWSEMTSQTTTALYAVWGSSSSDVYAVGNSGVIRHFDGSSWSTVSSGTTQVLNCVTGTASNDVWIGGNGQTILHYNGTSWSSQVNGFGNNVSCMWAAGTNDVWLGSGAYTWHWNGTIWAQSPTSMQTSGSVNGIFGFSSTDIIITTSQGEIKRYNGTTWGNVITPIGYSLFPVWGSAANDVFVGGGWGEIQHWNGTSWTRQTTNVGSLTTNDYFRAIWGSGSSSIFVTGQFGTNGGVLRYNGSSWAGMTMPASQPLLYGIWGSSATDVFAVGTGGSIIHYNGTTWTAQTSNTTNFLFSVWGSSANNVLAFGVSGTIMQYNGTTWSAMTSGTANALRAGWGTAANYVFAVGNSGDIRHYNGSAWAGMTSGTTYALMGVWGSSMTNVYAVGGLGTILHYNGTSWSSVTSPTTENLWSIWGSSASDIYVVGENGTGLHYNGTSWSRLAVITDHDLYGVWGAASNDVYAIGYYRDILHFP
jgi:hypothetical protein